MKGWLKGMIIGAVACIGTGTVLCMGHGRQICLFSE